MGKPPGSFQVVGGALATAGRTIAAVVKGEAVKVTKEQNEERLEICSACKDLVNKEQSQENWKCALCKCNLAGKVLAAASLRTKDCPAGKWPKIPLAV